MRWIRTALLCLVAVALAMPAMPAGRELRMGAKHIPSKVREAAETAVPGIALDGAKVERIEGGMAYIVTGATDGKRYKIKVNNEGVVLDVDESEGIGLSEVPEAASKAALKALPGARLIGAQLAPSKTDTKMYRLELAKDGKTYHADVSAKGELQGQPKVAPAAKGK